MLAIARIRSAHGVRGEVKADVLTDFPQRFRRTTTVWVGSPPIEHHLERTRLVDRQVILKFRGVETREQAQALRGQLVQVPESQAWPLPPGRYYWHQIVGLEVQDTAGRQLGRVTEILQTPSNDVYVVHANGREWLLPATREVIRSVDLAGGRLIVDLLPGMGPGA